MKTFAIFGPDASPRAFPGVDIQTAVIDDVPVHCGIVETGAPSFQADDPANRHMVLIRVAAFSVNFRDKSMIFKMSRRGPADRVYIIGSEFVAEVLEVGPGVNELSVGDTVIGNNAYPSSGWEGLTPGVPSNHASREIQILHKAKLAKVPALMPKEVAASFSIGGQTTYSMLRRLELFEGANVLVTSAKSNTSLFAINALRKHKVNVFATSTSSDFHSELGAMGVKQLCVISPNVSFKTHPVIAEVSRNGGFHFVIDPYWDLHFSRSLEVMATGAKYVTCGLYDQYLSLIDKAGPTTYRTGAEFVTIMMNNLSVLGNCIGLTEDLSRAIDDYAAGILNVVVDCSFTDGAAADFLLRSYAAKDRFGKVVFRYS